MQGLPVSNVDDEYFMAPNTQEAPAPQAFNVKISLILTIYGISLSNYHLLLLQLTCTYKKV